MSLTFFSGHQSQSEWCNFSQFFVIVMSTSSSSSFQFTISRKRCNSIIIFSCFLVPLFHLNFKPAFAWSSTVFTYLSKFRDKTPSICFNLLWNFFDIFIEPVESNALFNGSKIRNSGWTVKTEHWKLKNWWVGSWTHTMGASTVMGQAHVTSPLYFTVRLLS